MEYLSKLYHAYIVEKDHRKFRYVSRCVSDVFLFNTSPIIKTQEMCDKAVKHDYICSKYVPDQFQDSRDVQ